MSADREWYRSAFDARYLLLYPHRSDQAGENEAQFAKGALNLAAGDRLADLGCGYGRHAAAFAKRGLAVTGVDLSPELLAAARARGVPGMHLVCGDLRRLPLASGTFDAATFFFTSFGYFEDEADDRRALQESARILRGEGGIIFDYLNEASVRENVVPVSNEERGDVAIRQERSISADGRRVENRITFSRDGKPLSEMRQSVRLWSRPELHVMFEDAGFAVEEVFGDLDGRPFTKDAPRCVLIARKARPAGEAAR